MTRITMQRGAALAIVAGFLGWTGAACAQESITIKIREVGEGDTIVFTQRATRTVNMKITNANGKIVQDDKENGTELTNYTETILKRRPGELPTKRQRRYGEMETVENGKTQAAPLQDKTVIIERLKDKYTFTYPGGEEVAGPAATQLAEEFTPGDDFLEEIEKQLFPKGAVKIGATFKVDMARFIKEYNKDPELQFDAARSSGSGKLLKVYDKAGKRFGVLNFKLEMAMATSGRGDEQIKYGPGSKVVVEATYDTCIDGTADTGSLKMKTVTTGTGPVGKMPGSTFTVNSTVETAEEHEEKTKKK